MATEIGMDILREGRGHGQGVLRSQDHWAGATGDTCGKDRVKAGQASPTGPPSQTEKGPEAPRVPTNHVPSEWRSWADQGVRWEQRIPVGMG